MLVEIIDDDAAIREIIEYVVLQCIPGIEVVAGAQCNGLDREPDVLVIDYRLGDLRLGTEHTCTKHRPKIIYFTGYPMPETVNGNVVVAKPDFDRLIEEIKKATSK